MGAIVGVGDGDATAAAVAYSHWVRYGPLGCLLRRLAPQSAETTSRKHSPSRGIALCRATETIRLQLLQVGHIAVLE